MISYLLSFFSLSLGSIYLGDNRISGLNKVDNSGNNITIDYYLAFNGNTRIGGGENPYYYTYSYNSCLDLCSLNDTCSGVYFGNIENLPEINGSGMDESNNTLGCYLFSNLGYPIEDDILSYSYIKTSHYVNQNLNNSNYIFGYISDYAYNNLNLYSSIVYLDYNHNGILDNNEPNETVRHNNYFNFTELLPGNYLVREIPPIGCEQLYPGVLGDNNPYYYYYNENSYLGDSYVDYVQSYYHHGHNMHAVPHGGYINSNETFSNSNFSFVLGDDNTTYMSFYPGYNVTFMFVDETIIHKDNITDNLFIETYGESETMAHISVSNDGISYYNLSVLSSENNSFNTGDIKNLSLPIAYLRLHFFSNNNDANEALNIIRIYGEHNSLYKPEFGYYVSLPFKSTATPYISFHNNCNYLTHCYGYCGYTTFSYDSDEACLYGCDMLKTYETCFCDMYNSSVPSEYAYYYGDENNFDYNACNNGCEYNMEKFVFPHYQVLINRTGSYSDIIDTIYNCGDSCIDMLSFSCSQNEICQGFSVFRNQSGKTFSGLTETINNNSYLIVKTEHMNSLLDNLSLTTPMPSTSMPSTSMPTTSMPSTSMPTTSMPTTSMPTTSMPTTSMPTTSMPTTSMPTTSMPTIIQNNNVNPSVNQNNDKDNDTRDIVIYVMLGIISVNYYKF